MSKRGDIELLAFNYKSARFFERSHVNDSAPDSALLQPPSGTRRAKILERLIQHSSKPVELVVMNNAR